MKNLTAVIVLILFAITSYSQIDSMVYKSPERLAAKSLEILSCKKGEIKDWEEYRSLFLPNATKLNYRPKPGRPLFMQANDWNVDEFIKYVGPRYPETGFEEYVIGSKVHEFNGIAIVFQSFYCKALDGSYEARGVNSYQMVFLDNRWWIASTMFTNETDDNKIPDELLFEKYRSKK